MNTASNSGSRRWREIKRHWQLYLLLLLPIAYLLVFKYAPMIGAQIAFRKYRVNTGIWGSPWVGFDNFTKFFRSSQFSRVLTNTLSISFYSLLAGFPFPVLLALLLNAVRSPGAKRFVQNLTYLPYFISTVVMVGILIQIFNTHNGVYGVTYKALTGATAPDILAKPAGFLNLYVWSGVWQGMGWGSIIYIAALSNVDVEQHEAALLDGATRFQRILHVDIPAIMPTIIITLLLRCGSIMNVGFEKAYLMQNNLNLRASEVISTYVYKVGLTATGNFSYATAIGMFNSVVNLSVLVVMNAISRKVSDSSIW